MEGTADQNHHVNYDRTANSTCSATYIEGLYGLVCSQDSNQTTFFTNSKQDAQ